MNEKKSFIPLIMEWCKKQGSM